MSFLLPGLIPGGDPNTFITDIGKGLGHGFDVLTGESSDKRKDELYTKQLTADNNQFERSLNASAQLRLDEAKVRAQDRMDEREDRRLARADEIAREERRYKYETENRIALIQVAKDKDASDAIRKSGEIMAKEQADREKLNASIYSQQRQDSIANARLLSKDIHRGTGEEFLTSSSAPSYSQQVKKRDFGETAKPFDKISPLIDIGLALAGGALGSKFLGAGIGGRGKSAIAGELALMLGERLASGGREQGQTSYQRSPQSYADIGGHSGYIEVGDLLERRQTPVERAAEISAGSSQFRDTTVARVRQYERSEPSLRRGRLSQNVDISYA